MVGQGLKERGNGIGNVKLLCVNCGKPFVVTESQLELYLQECRNRLGEDDNWKRDKMGELCGADDFGMALKELMREMKTKRLLCSVSCWNNRERGVRITNRILEALFL